MLQEHLPRSLAALKRHQKKIGPQVAELRRHPGMAERTDLELVLYALGDGETQQALTTYWQHGGVHPITDMDAEDQRALDRSIAQAIVLAATCDPAARVREKDAKSRD